MGNLMTTLRTKYPKYGLSQRHPLGDGHRVCRKYFEYELSLYSPKERVSSQFPDWFDPLLSGKALRFLACLMVRAARLLKIVFLTIFFALSR
ncbi:hypothetical protein Lepto7375DRAFT_6999 [Leptolyngbya sp. PCC 7375]|nr:hypothetical protein Lepto7375DRAFT_6999 [Leptolyngbya sp. PCC 7375]